MRMSRTQWWAAGLVAVVALTTTNSGCSRRKQVPFGLVDAGTADAATPEEVEEPPSLPVGETFESNQAEVAIGDAALVLESGYALGALRVDLDGAEPIDAIVVSGDAEEIRMQAAFARGLGVTSVPVDAFRVPEDCTGPKTDMAQLSSSLAAVRVDHDCKDGPRTNIWVLTIEAQPRVRERITVFPPNARSDAPIEIALSVQDRDADGYDDVVADVRVGDVDVPLTWLNRPGGFARDTSQPEESFRLLADDAWAFLDSDPRTSEARARSVVAAFVALCRESGAARIGLMGAQGIQCQHSDAGARAIAVATVSAIRRGLFVRALELQRAWDAGVMRPSAEERALVQAAWRKAKASRPATWRVIDTQSATTSLHFTSDDTLVADGRSPTSFALSTGARTKLSADQVRPAIRSPDGRFAVRGVRVTCAGFEAEVGPALGKRTHRVLIERRPGTTPCQTPIDRPASVFEWAVIGWAPQGLVCAAGDRLRVVPVTELARPAGQPIELRPGSPLPAPIIGARVTPNGDRYVIPHAEGVVVRQWGRGGGGLWLRPTDWAAVSGTLRSLAISPSGTRIAVQKGNEIRLLSW